MFIFQIWNRSANKNKKKIFV